MSADREPLHDLFVFETNQFLELVEGILLISEESKRMSDESINEIFRAMHSIKGSASMMSCKNISSVAHAVEDLFDYIRNNPETDIRLVSDLLLSAVDFIKSEISKVSDDLDADADESELVNKIRGALGRFRKGGGKAVKSKTCNKLLTEKKNKAGIDEKKYAAKVFFEDGCLMENVRAFSLVYSLNDKCGELYYFPENIEDDTGDATEFIKKNGLDIFFSSVSDYNELEDVFRQTLFLKSYTLNRVESLEEYINGSDNANRQRDKSNKKRGCADFISVSSGKLDRLLDLVGEIVIAESMVAKHPAIEKLDSESFDQRSVHLRKLIEELQDNVMSTRMIPISGTLQKFNRVVRDMCKSLNKEAELIIRGEETELDKNIVSSLSDSLMHVIRNSMDHGIETAEERKKAGKQTKGKIEITAESVGGEVVITVKDDGRGLDRGKIYKKARAKGLIHKPENECTDAEVFQCILSPGFSMRDTVSEFSGRGVGLDVVKDNIIKIGGVVSVGSEKGNGATVEMRFPLTMAIIGGIFVSVGDLIYTIPTSAVCEFSRGKERNIGVDTNGNEFIMLRGKCIPVIRLSKSFNIHSNVQKLTEGILIFIERENKAIALFADSIVGEQYVVTKPLPDYLNKFELQQKGISGCTILGDGNISLILDINMFFDNYIS